MKFLYLIILLISSLTNSYWAYLCGVPNILVQSHLLYFQYSMLHNQLPKNVVPNIAFSTQETPFECGEMFDLSASLQKNLHLLKLDIQHVYEHDLYLQPLSKSSHSQNYKFVLLNPCIVFEYLRLIHDTYISLPILYEHLIDLRNGYFVYNLSCCKYTKFIETKVPEMKFQGFNLFFR